MPLHLEAVGLIIASVAIERAESLMLDVLILLSPEMPLSLMRKLSGWTVFRVGWCFRSIRHGRRHGSESDECCKSNINKAMNSIHL